MVRIDCVDLSVPNFTAPQTKFPDKSPTLLSCYSCIRHNMSRTKSLAPGFMPIGVYYSILNIVPQKSYKQVLKAR